MQIYHHNLYRMSCLETAEYYKWLFCIEAQEFEKELLEIVSDDYI